MTNQEMRDRIETIIAAGGETARNVARFIMSQSDFVAAVQAFNDVGPQRDFANRVFAEIRRANTQPVTNTTSRTGTNISETVRERWTQIQTWIRNQRRRWF